MSNSALKLITFFYIVVIGTSFSLRRSKHLGSTEGAFIEPLIIPHVYDYNSILLTFFKTKCVVLYFFYSILYVHRHVVFGRVLEGENVVRSIEAVGSPSGTPQKKVVIVDSGEL